MRVGGGERDEEREVTTTQGVRGEGGRGGDEEREVTTTQGVRGEEGDTILSYLHHHYS